MKLRSNSEAVLLGVDHREVAMNNGERRSLCAALLHADAEDEVIDLLTNAGLWEDTGDWRH